ncbi:MAG: hypothetical protein HYR56_15685 [Acidobacteria bacterium]|nr:hypothetical protein [Acidobacteriota bacterium]
MPKPEVSFEGNQVSVGARKWNAPYLLEYCAQVDDKILVIYEHSPSRTWGQFHNLEAFDLTGHKLWTAEHPTNETADSYVQFLALDPLTVLNFAGFIYQIDLATGKILTREFTK